MYVLLLTNKFRKWTTDKFDSSYPVPIKRLTEYGTENPRSLVIFLWLISRKRVSFPPDIFLQERF